MKVSGNGNLVFKKFFKELQKKKKKKKNSASPQQIEEAKKIAKQLLAEPKPIFTQWEEKVRKKLKRSGIVFESRFRKFPLIMNERVVYEYEPDFILKNHSFEDKHILIEAHENITENDLIKYSLFMEKYYNQYYLIMIVKSEQLRNWNEFHHNKKPIFNDIWTWEDLDYFIDYIKKYETKSKDIVFPQCATCPHCQQIAQDTKQIHELFGYRKMKGGLIRTQSLCKKCRKEHTKMRLGKPNEYSNRKKTISHQKEVLCIGCQRKFKTLDPEQAYCKSCLEEF